jgi:hypothetical protein
MVQLPVEEPSPRITVYLTIHAPKDRTFVEELEYARTAFAPHGVELLIADVRLIDAVPWGDMRWRRSVASLMPLDGTVHVFFVEKCLDTLKDAGQPIELRGVSWVSPGKRFAAVAEGAPVTTFSHEIGHLLSLDHVEDPKNIMCSCTREGEAKFTSDQGDAMQSPFRHR